MLTFPDPNVETEYTDPNGSVWQFNGTGWVRQPESSGGGGGGGMWQFGSEPLMIPLDAVVSIPLRVGSANGGNRNRNHQVASVDANNAVTGYYRGSSDHGIEWIEHDDQSVTRCTSRACESVADWTAIQNYSFAESTFPYNGSLYYVDLNHRYWQIQKSGVTKIADLGTSLTNSNTSYSTAYHEQFNGRKGRFPVVMVLDGGAKFATALPSISTASKTPALSIRIFDTLTGDLLSEFYHHEDSVVSATSGQRRWLGVMKDPVNPDTYLFPLLFGDTGNNQQIHPIIFVADLSTKTISSKAFHYDNRFLGEVKEAVCEWASNNLLTYRWVDFNSSSVYAYRAAILRVPDDRFDMNGYSFGYDNVESNYNTGDNSNAINGWDANFGDNAVWIWPARHTINSSPSKNILYPEKQRVTASIYTLDGSKNCEYGWIAHRGRGGMEQGHDYVASHDYSNCFSSTQGLVFGPIASQDYKIHGRLQNGCLLVNIADTSNNKYGILNLETVQNSAVFARIDESGNPTREIVYAKKDHGDPTLVPVADAKPPVDEFEKYGDFEISYDSEAGVAVVTAEVVPMTEEEIRAMQESNEEQSE
jgi:hypothetical protein